MKISDGRQAGLLAGISFLCLDLSNLIKLQGSRIWRCMTWRNASRVTEPRSWLTVTRTKKTATGGWCGWMDGWSAGWLDGTLYGGLLDGT